jgi:hypothetical protein
MRFVLPGAPRAAASVVSRRTSTRGAVPSALPFEVLEERQLMSLTNPSFEQGIVGWTADPTNSTNVRATPISADGTTRAQSGNNFAQLTASNSSLDLGRYATLSNTFEAQAGDTISGYAFFKNRALGSNTGNGDSYVAIKTGFGNTVQTLFDQGVDTVGPNGSTGWTYFEYTFNTPGVYRIEAGVANLAGPAPIGNYLGLDNVQFSGTDAAPGTTAPVVDAGGPYEVTEGQPLTVTARGYDVDDDVITYRWDVNGDGRFDATGRTATFTAAQLQGLGVGDGPGTYTIIAQADDGRGHRSTDTATLTVTNGPPVIDDRFFRLPSESTEGRPLTATVSATDPAGRGDSVRFEWSVTRDGQTVVDRAPGGGSASGSRFTYTPQDDGTYTITAHAIDDDGGESSASRTVVVTNVAPTITSFEGPMSGVRGQERSYSASFSDPAGDDTHVTAWSVTDASGEVVATGTGTEFAFTPADAGDYTVSFGVTDDDGGTAATSQALHVSAVRVQADPADPAGSVLAVGGTLGKDHVDLLPGAEAGTIEVLIDDVSQGTFSGVSGVIVYGQAGDDFVHVGRVGVPVTFYGGAGNDKLHTRSFSDVLIGGDGDDYVLGRGPAQKIG